VSIAATEENARGKFIVFSLIGSIGRSRTIIFPDGSKADGWFAITRLLKESLLSRKGEAPVKKWKRAVANKPRVGRSPSYAEAVRGRGSDLQSPYLRGWRCKQCGSCDVFAAVLGEDQVSVTSGQMQQRGAECVQSRGEGLQ